MPRKTSKHQAPVHRRVAILPSELVIDDDRALIGSDAFREIAAAAIAECHSPIRPSID